MYQREALRISNESLCTMVIQVAPFSSGGTKSERFLHKNQHTQRKISLENKDVILFSDPNSQFDCSLLKDWKIF